MAEIIGEAWVAIRATDAGFEATVFKDVEKAMLAVNKKVPAIKPEADVSKATGPLDVLKARLQSFAGKNPMTAALKDIETASGGAEGALAGFATAGVAIAAAAITAFAIKGVADFLSLTAQARQLQRITGQSAEDSSRMAAGFRAVGIEVSAAAVAVGRFERNIATNEPKLNALGIAITRTSKGTVDMKETFSNLADVISKTEDPTKRAEIAIAALGRGGLAMLPILIKGREGVTEMFKEADKTHTLFSQKDLDTGLQLSLALKNIKESITGAFAQAGKVVAPFVLDVINLAKGVGELATKFDVVKDVIKAALEIAFAPLIVVVQGIHDLSVVVQKLSGTYDENQKAASGAAVGADEVAAAETKLQAEVDKANAVLDAQAKKIDALKNVFENVITAKRADVAALDAVNAAKVRVSDSTAHLNDLLAKGVINTQALTAAKKNLETSDDNLAAAEQRVLDAGQAIIDAQFAQQDALKGLADAQQAYDDLVSGKTAAKDLASHHNDLAKANNAVTQATLNQHDAQKNLDKVRSSGLATVDELTAAQLKLDEANVALSDAQDAVATTQKNLTDIQNEGVTGSATLEAAQKTLDVAHKTLDGTVRVLNKAYQDQKKAMDDVVTAGQDVIDKQALVDKALLPDPALVAAISAARKTQTSDTQGVADALSNVSAAAGSWSEKQIALDAHLKTETLPNLLELKNRVQAIVNLHPESAAFYKPLQEMIDKAIGDFKALLLAAVPPPPAPVNLSPIIGSTIDASGSIIPNIPSIPNIFRGGQAGGYFTGSFLAGEAGTELVSLRPGGGAMVYPAHDPASQAGGGGVNVTVNIDVNASGLGSPAELQSLIADVAKNEVALTVQRVIDRARAGAR